MANNTFGIILRSLKKLISLEFEFMRLTLADKLVSLFSVIALSIITLLIGMCAMIFISIGFVKMLSAILSDYWGYIILGLCYICILILLFCFKRILVINPISRLITKLILNSPKRIRHE